MNSRLTANDGPVQSYGLIMLFLDSVILGFLLLGPLGGVIEPALQAAEIARSANRPTLRHEHMVEVGLVDRAAVDLRR